MQKRSPNSAGATYLNREERIQALREAAGRAARRFASIRRILLFGSLTAGIPTPRSDADILVEVNSSPHRQPRDRIPEILAAFSPLPCPIDLLVLTSEEIASEAGRASPVLREAFASGLDLI